MIYSLAHELFRICCFHLLLSSRLIPLWLENMPFMISFLLSETFKQQGCSLLDHFPLLLLGYRWHKALGDDVATKWGKFQTWITTWKKAAHLLGRPILVYTRARNKLQLFEPLQVCFCLLYQFTYPDSNAVYLIKAPSPPHTLTHNPGSEFLIKENLYFSSHYPKHIHHIYSTIFMCLLTDKNFIWI